MQTCAQPRAPPPPSVRPIFGRAPATEARSSIAASDMRFDHTDARVDLTICSLHSPTSLGVGSPVLGLAARKTRRLSEAEALMLQQCWSRGTCAGREIL